ncbi:AraC family transcriptional regulator [Desertivirga arenae]|uniref:AraC family transcriptional regulator n=1 Tax=Desertivirga arenae TaxID=2810309 RepID=UPI001A96B643|nr:GyrI-like domain-containing protein [Pedobacter sp. SYSU D00823]
MIGSEEIKIDYQRRLNRVFEFIDENLNSDLSLSIVADVAFFSPYHFHRIFKSITGETLNDYVSRRKIEKAGADLLHTNLKSIEIAHKYGYADDASFSKAFKKFFGVSPTTFKKQNPNRHSKIRQLDSKTGQAYPDSDKYLCIINELKEWIKMNAKIEVREMPEMNLAYVSNIGPQNLADSFNKLVRWASPQGLLNGDTKMLTIYHDSFKVTEPSKVRMSACIVLTKSVDPSSEIGLASMDPGKCIVASLEIHLDEFEKSWQGLFVWMNENGYKKAERNPFEIYHNNFNEHPERKSIVDFCIPVIS